MRAYAIVKLGFGCDTRIDTFRDDASNGDILRIFTDKKRAVKFVKEHDKFTAEVREVDIWMRLTDE